MPDIPITRQTATTLGGTRVYTHYSGVVGPDILIASGAGRLDAAFFLDSALVSLSGQPVTFYDGAPVSGGPLAASSHKVLGVLAPQADTGTSGAALRGGKIVNFGFVFSSGLVHSTRSGQPGFSVSFTQ
jgi:hypothetical protein